MNEPETSDGKRCLPISILRVSKRSQLAIYLWHPNNQVLNEKDSSGSEVPDMGDDLVPMISEHDTRNDIDMSDIQAIIQLLIEPVETISVSSSEHDDRTLSRLRSLKGTNRYK